jgi:hypothetical protein
MDNELEKQEKFNRPADEGEDVEAHKFIEDETKREKFVESSSDEDDEVEAHKF